MTRPVQIFVGLLVSVQPLVAAFDRPTLDDIKRARGLLDECGLAERRLYAIDSDFQPIPYPGPRDWLSQHQESGQTFDEFVESGSRRPDVTRRFIYLQPLGEFAGSLGAPSLAELQSYAAAYFQMDVRLLPPSPLHPQSFGMRVNPHSGRQQLLTTSILSFLRRQIPDDAFCVLGITMTDLYPSPSWNFVFGQASLRDRVGVFSFARYDPAFFGEARPAGYETLILERSCKVLVHETGHMFGMHHCIYMSCAENGANNQAEGDLTPHHLCPVCLRKLQSSVGFDLVERYRDLARFYERNKWLTKATWARARVAKAVNVPVLELSE